MLMNIPLPLPQPFFPNSPTCPAPRGGFALKKYLWGGSKELGWEMSKC